MPELGLDGPAEVTLVETFAPITPGKGRVVTGTFAHESADVLDLYLEGLDAPLGVTANHPLWSDDRQSFVPADRLHIGEQLRPIAGHSRVQSMQPRPGKSRVYILEVNVEHVY